MYRSLGEESRVLRKQQTAHEKSLWDLLRNRRLSEFKFRRQFVIEPYIVDFCCPGNKVIIELDGAPHRKKERKIHDQQRDDYLRKLGYRIVRIWNGELRMKTIAVLNRIEGALASTSETSPSPWPSPQRERELKR